MNKYPTQVLVRQLNTKQKKHHVKQKMEERTKHNFYIFKKLPVIAITHTTMHHMKHISPEMVN